MTVRTQSGTTVFVNSGQTVQTPQVQNAGTITNAGTTRVSQAPPREGIGEGVGTARTSPIPFSKAAGLGEGIGDALTARQTPQRASGIGEGIGTADQAPVFTRIAAGLGEGFGTTTAQPDTDSVASGIGEMFGTGNQFVFETIAASGFGEMLGTARKPIPFDPIQQIVNLINKTNDSRWRYGKPERIAPIWEYSHNDRVNYPDPALYIYTPAESVVDKFGIEGDNFNQTITIEILIMTLESSETQGYVGDTTTLITQLFDDNAKNSNFHRFSNLNAADLRNEHITQQTDQQSPTRDTRKRDNPPIESVLV